MIESMEAGRVGENNNMKLEIGGVLERLIAQQERALQNAQHRIAVALAQDNLAMLREVRMRLLVDKGLIGMIQSGSVRSAVSDVMSDFEHRVQSTFESVDRITDKLIACYAEEEELQAACDKSKEVGDTYMRKMFGGKKAANAYSEALEFSMRRSEKLAYALALRKEVADKRSALNEGQRNVLALVEEFLQKGMAKQHVVPAEQ